MPNGRSVPGTPEVWWWTLSDFGSCSTGPRLGVPHFRREVCRCGSRHRSLPRFGQGTGNSRQGQQEGCAIARASAGDISRCDGIGLVACSPFGSRRSNAGGHRYRRECLQPDCGATGCQANESAQPLHINSGRRGCLARSTPVRKPTQRRGFAVVGCTDPGSLPLDQRITAPAAIGGAVGRVPISGSRNNLAIRDPPRIVRPIPSLGDCSIARSYHRTPFGNGPHGRDGAMARRSARRRKRRRRIVLDSVTDERSEFLERRWRRGIVVVGRTTTTNDVPERHICGGLVVAHSGQPFLTQITLS